MNSLKNTLTLAQISRRALSQSTVLRSAESAKFKSLKETQKTFTVDDGVPVYIKSGFKDKILYQGTLVLTAIGLAMAGETLYCLSYPKKE